MELQKFVSYVVLSEAWIAEFDCSVLAIFSILVM